MQLIRRVVLVVAALAGPLCICTNAHADDTFVAKTQVYTDSDKTTVVSPVVAIRRDAWKGATVDASYVADVVSSASVDVISNATSQMTDFRSEITGGLSQVFGSTTLSGSYIYSIENDYSSNNLSFGISQDLFQRNTTLALGYSLSLNDVERTGDRSFHRSLDVNGIGASWTQAINPRTIAQLSYTLSYGSGYWASPYRFVALETGDGAIAFKVPESEPTERWRHAFVLGVNRHLGLDSSIQADYRFYVDSWGVKSHTVQARYFVNFGDFTLRLRERFYYQGAADFFQSHYYVDDGIPNYITFDRELSTFWSNVVGAKIAWHIPWSGLAFALEAKADVFYFQYIDFAWLANRVGATLEGGVSLVY